MKQAVLSLFPVAFTCILLLMFSGCAGHQQYTPDFNFRHTKAKGCDEFWLTFERVVKNEGARCSELVEIDGFPYLRGTEELVSAGLSLNDRKAVARWLEFMRTADMQARYRELDALSDTSWGILCSEADIYNCEAGRLKAHTARCSALLLGDERMNPDFSEKLAKAAEAAVKRGHPKGRACFENPESLDGAIPDNLLKALTDPESGYRGAASLEKRVNRSKAMSSGSRLMK